jgi:hypothetical protein
MGEDTPIDLIEQVERLTAEERDSILGGTAMDLLGSAGRG